MEHNSNGQFVLTSLTPNQPGAYLYLKYGIFSRNLGATDVEIRQTRGWRRVRTYSRSEVHRLENNSRQVVSPGPSTVVSSQVKNEK
jgi:hypothetical protein